MVDHVDEEELESHGHEVVSSDEVLYNCCSCTEDRFSGLMLVKVLTQSYCWVYWVYYLRLNISVTPILVLIPVLGSIPAFCDVIQAPILIFALLTMK